MSQKSSIFLVIDSRTILEFATLEALARSTCPHLEIKKGQKIFVDIFEHGERLARFSEIAEGYFRTIPACRFMRNT